MKVLRQLWPVAFAATVLAVVWSAHAQVSGAPVGRALAANCFQCHGTDGRALNGMPSIAGKDAPSLYSDMLEYKGSTNYTNIMVPIAHAYTDQELWELSLYIASLPEHVEGAAQNEGGEPVDQVDIAGAVVEAGGEE